MVFHKSRTGVLFIKNFIVLWRNGLWTLPSLLFPTFTGLLILVMFYKGLEVGKPTAKGGVSFRKLRVPLLNQSDPRRAYNFSAYYHEDHHKKQNWTLNNSFLDSGNDASYNNTEAVEWIRKSKFLHRLSSGVVYSFNVEEFDSSRSANFVISVNSTSWPVPFLTRKLTVEMYGNLPSDFDTFVKDVLDFQIVFTKKIYNTDYDISTNLREAIVVPSGGQQLRRWTSIFTTVVLLVLFPATLLNCMNIWSERKSGMKELMEIMGAGGIHFYVSHGITAFICNQFLIAILFVPNILYFINTSYLLLMFIVSFLLALSSALISFVCSTFSNSMTTTAVLCFLVWCLLFFLSLITSYADTKSSLIYVLNLNPLAAYKTFYDITVTYHIRGASDLVLTTSLYYDCLTPFEIISYLVVSCLLMIVYLILYEADWCASYSSLDELPKNEVDADALEAELAAEQIAPSIQFCKVSKCWNSAEQCAVANVSFRAFSGQTTVLFGHSGSGKTTLAKLITGEAKMNCGSVSVMSATKRNNHGYQNGIGYCPQKNVLFDYLTVLDHLWFFNSLKNGPINWLSEAINVARAVGLHRLLNVRACELSGVQRRFLGIAVALVGGSHLVVIDEPIQHSDPEIKGRFKEIIKSEKDSRCILISTSSTETTDLVGDRILVLQSGRILASGSRSFLKNKFGCDYILSISLDDQMTTDYHKDCVTLFVRALIPDAELRETFDSSFVFGFSSEDLDVQIALYREFQVNRVLLGISDFHIRRCTLADVIRKIETTKEDGDSEKTIKNSVADREKADPHCLFCLLLKKRLNLLLNARCIFLQVIIPMAVVVFAIGLHKTQRLEKPRARDVSLGIYEHGRFLVFDPHDMKELTLPIVTALSAFPEIEVVLLRTTNFCKEWPNDWPFVIGAVAIGTEIGLWNFDDDTCSLHMATPSALHNPRTDDLCKQWNCSYEIPDYGVNSTNNEIWVVPNISIYGYPSIVQLLTKVHLGNGVQRVKVWIEVGAFEWPLLPMMVANSIGIAHVLLGCSFVIVPVQERRHFFKQQQFLSGLSLSTYWLTNFVFDAAIIFMMVSMFTVFFIMPPINISLIFLIILYAYVIGQLPTVYLMSLFFRQAENATIFFTTLTVCYPFVLNAIFPTKWIDVCCMFLPALAFFRYLEESLKTEKELSTKDSPLLSFVINFVIFSLLLFTVELRPLRFRNHRKAADEVFIIENKAKKSQNFNEFATDNPENDFSPVMEPMVLRGVPLVLHPGEIVGIFGEKRNTRSIIMRILSNYLCPLSHIDTQFSVKEIGFCPRHDSLHPLLSLRRNLEIVATIAGRSSAIDKDNFVQVAMRNIREPHREFGLHSPMERRRACVTAALLSRSKVLVFDQPTEMVDYKTRIFIWEAIKEARKSGRAVVIVTDSVEECETLCNRIGIISAGAELLTIGTVSELRAKYGMFVVIELYPLTKSDKRKAIDAISQAFPKARLLQQSSSDPGKLKWKLPITKEEDIPQLMEKLKNLLLSVSVRDGSLMKASLQELISNAHELIQMSIE